MFLPGFDWKSRMISVPMTGFGPFVKLGGRQSESQ